MENTEAPETAAPRQPAGWLILLAIFLFIFTKSLGGYLHRDEAGNPSHFSEEFSLRYNIMLKQFGKNLGPSMNQTIDLNKRVLEDLKPKRAHDEMAEALYAEASYESGKSIPADSLAHLASSKDPKVRALGKIYDKAALTKSERLAAADLLPTDDFVYRLARAHARAMEGVPNPYKDAVSASSFYGILAAFGLVGLAICGGALLLIVMIVVKASGSLPFLGNRSDPMTLPDADKYAMIAAFILCIFIALSLIFAVLKGARLNSPWMDIAEAACMIAATLWATRYRPIGWERLGISKEKLGVHILWGVGAAIANAPIVLVLAIVGTRIFSGLPQAEHPVEQLLVDAKNPLVIISLFVLASIQAPIFEETVFRGLFQPALARLMGKPIVAGIITSFVFASIHPTGIPAWPALAAIGGMSVLLTYQTRSLVPSIVMHAVHNGVTLLLGLALSH